MGDAVTREMMSALIVNLHGSTGPVGGGGGGPQRPSPLPQLATALSLEGVHSGGVRTISIRIQCWFGVNTTWC